MSKAGAHSRSMSPEDMFRRSQQFEGVGRFREALELGRTIVKQRPQWAHGHYVVGSSLCGLGLLEEADAALRKAIAREETQAGFHNRRSEVLNRLGHRAEADAASARAVELAPDDPRVLVTRAMVVWLSGDPHAGFACLQDAIERGIDDPRLRSVHAAISAQVGRRDEGIAALEALLEEQLERMLRSEVLLSLAKLYDKVGRYDEAFGAAREGGALRQTGYDPEQARARCADRLAAWSAGRIERVPESRVKSELPVFIVGMPRSGTSLVEQIIASHPRAYGGGEMMETWHAAMELTEPTELIDDRAQLVEQLKPASLDRHARKILKAMERAGTRELGVKPERVTDKLPGNYEHVGLIAKLFPGARIIHCVRNPLDTCVSCFMLDFTGDQNHGYSYDLEHLAAQYKVYQQYMNHWRAVSPIEMLEVRYEELVGNPERGVRRIIEHIGLEWDDACARPHETKRAVSTLSSDQVRRPIYTGSRERWRNYEAHIGALIEALGARIG